MDFDHDFRVSLPVRSEERPPQDVGDMGPIDLLRKTLQMLKVNRPVFMWIQFALVVPLMICLFLYVTIIVTFIPSAEDLNDELWLSPPGEPEYPVDDALDNLDLLKLGFIFVLLLIMLALGPSLSGAILHSVGNLYDGKSITIAEVFKAIPSLRKGLRSTQKWGALLNLPVIIVLGILSGFAIYILMYFVDHQTGEDEISFSWLLKMEVLLFLVALAVLLPYLFFLSTLLPMAQCVACLEGTHGLAAVKKGWSLLKGRWKVALGLSAVLDLPQILVGGLIGLAVVNLMDMKDDSIMHTVTWLILMTLSMATTGMVQIALMTRALFYISCKAYHHESFDMDAQNQLGSGGYEPIGKSKLSDDEASPGIMS